MERQNGPADAERLLGLPLFSLPIVFLDTETTGLHVASDRIIEIGALRVEAGRIKEKEKFECLINPNMPIPEASSRVHGLSDSDVRDAENIAKALPRFLAWAGNAVFMGFSVGFDLAIMNAECRRSGIRWTPPRSLDVRHLAQLLAPQLPDYSMELVARWLDVEIVDRHRASGDAYVSARIFQELVPRLRNKGVATLAQAERACNSLTQDVELETRAGWQEVVDSGRFVPESVIEYGRIDTFPYRHRVSYIMKSPAAKVPSQTPVLDVFKRLVEDNIDAVFVDDGAADGELGILTERHLIRTVGKLGAKALELPAGELARVPALSLEENEFLYRASSLMIAEQVGHLGVRDEGGRLIGSVGARDFLRQRASDAISLGNSLRTAKTPEELGQIWSRLSVVVHGLIYEGVPGRDITAIISREMRALTARACEIAENELHAAGLIRPSARYAVLVLGSGGRGESTLAMEQDNALVFEDPADNEMAWFEKFGERVSEVLDLAGVSFCSKGTMLSEQEWRNSVSEWAKLLSQWMETPQPDNIAKCNIFLDGVFSHGDKDLAEKVLQDSIALVAKNQQFLDKLFESTQSENKQVGWFGKFRLTHERVNLKTGGLLAINDCARALALANGNATKSTATRLEVGRGKSNELDDALHNLIEAHQIMIDLALRQQLRDLDEGFRLSSSVDLSELTDIEKHKLRWALDSVSEISKLRV